MTACLAQQQSSIKTNLTYPRRKLLRTMTYDSLMPKMTSRKRQLSEQNQCCNPMMNTDHIDINKRFKTGNFIKNPKE